MFKTCPDCGRTILWANAEWFHVVPCPADNVVPLRGRTHDPITEIFLASDKEEP